MKKLILLLFAILTMVSCTPVGTVCTTSYPVTTTVVQPYAYYPAPVIHVHRPTYYNYRRPYHYHRYQPRTPYRPQPNRGGRPYRR